MKRIVYKKLFDFSQSEEVIKVEALQGPCTLFQTNKANFFLKQHIGHANNLIPMTRDEALQFISIHMRKMQGGQYFKIIRKHFLFKEPLTFPNCATMIAETIGPVPEFLYYSGRGAFNQLIHGKLPEEIGSFEALQWLEDHQNEIENLDEVLHFYFPTLKPE